MSGKKTLWGLKSVLALFNPDRFEERQPDPEARKFFDSYFNDEIVLVDQEGDPSDHVQIARFQQKVILESVPDQAPEEDLGFKVEAADPMEQDVDLLPSSSIVHRPVEKPEPEIKKPVPVKKPRAISAGPQRPSAARTREVYGQPTMLQGFEWYLPADGRLWKQLGAQAEEIYANGYNLIWLPPAYKGHSGIHDVGYGVYDLYDLGEFLQKGSVSTKYGTKTQYLKAVASLQKSGIKVLADIVIDHRMGADQTEKVPVYNVDGTNRYRRTSGCYDATVWSKFTFDGRKGKYSTFEWNASCFNGADYNAANHRNGVMLFKDHSWNEHVSRELGNYDYVMGLCTDFHNQSVVQELHRWGEWYMKLTKVDGFRLDCLKSIDYTFFKPWLERVRQVAGKDQLHVVGEYWSGNIDELCGYLENSGRCMHLFDIPLHYHFFDCSRSHGRYDVRTLFNNTLTQRHPQYAVAFVDNHDTQPMQALCSWIEGWFKTSAYACVLLNRADQACVFWGDKVGIPHTKNPPVVLLEEMVWIRSRLLSKNIIDLYDEDAQKACWISMSDHPVLVLFSIGDQKKKQIQFQELKNKVFCDAARPDHRIQMNERGQGEFDCMAGCCSIYILEEDMARLQLYMKERRG